MRIVLSDFVSLDGVAQAPGGKTEDTDGGFAHGGWSMPYFDVEAMGNAVDETLRSTDALLFGRRTWKVMAGAWPERAGDPFADRMNELPKWVVSGTLSEDDLEWNTTLVRPDDLPGLVRDLRERPGGDVQVMGSLTLARWLLENDLVDELKLMIEPIILGGGKSVFPANGTARPLELVDVRPTKTGVQICTYRPVR